MMFVKKADLSGDKLYYIKYYTNIKSYWDHTDILLSNVLQDELLRYQPINNNKNANLLEIPLQKIPKYLDTWQYNLTLFSRNNINTEWLF